MDDLGLSDFASKIYKLHVATSIFYFNYLISLKVSRCIQRQRIIDHGIRGKVTEE